jgi:hypothetical protein
MLHSGQASGLIAPNNAEERIDWVPRGRQGNQHIRLPGLYTDNVYAVVGQQQMGQAAIAVGIFVSELHPGRTWRLCPRWFQPTWGVDE